MSKDMSHTPPSVPVPPLLCYFKLWKRGYYALQLQKPLRSAENRNTWICIAFEACVRFKDPKKLLTECLQDFCWLRRIINSSLVHPASPLVVYVVCVCHMCKCCSCDSKLHVIYGTSCLLQSYLLHSGLHVGY